MRNNLTGISGIPIWWQVAFWTNQIVGGRLARASVGAIIRSMFSNRIPSWNLRINTSRPEFTNVDVAALFWGTYEFEEIKFLKQYLRSDLDVVELGGSLGVLSTHIASILDSRSKIVTVEANHELSEAIRNNLRALASKRAWSLVEGAVSYSNHARMPLFVGSVNSATLNHSIDEKGAGGRVVNVPVITLDEVLREHKINKYVLVCDIEGSEVELLAKDSVSLVNCQQLLLEGHDTEYLGKKVLVEEIKEMVERLGFILVDRADKRPGLSVFLFNRSGRSLS